MQISKYKFFIYPYIFFYFISLGVSHTYGISGEGALGRITLSDLFLLPLLLGVFFKLCFQKIIVDKTIMTVIMIWLTSMFISSVFSTNPTKSFFEMVIHMFALAHGLSLFLIFNDSADSVKKSIWKLWIVTGGIITLINLVVFFLFPQVGSSAGAVSATFRNSGQAGTYISIAVISAIISFRTVKLGKFNRLTLLILIIEIVALLLTVKRAAIIGVSCALVGYFLYDSLLFTKLSIRKIVLAIGLVCVFGLTYFVGQNELSSNEDFAYRFARKVTSSYGQEVALGFFESNSKAALKAFQDRPFFGVGLGGVAGVYTEHFEIHSTPLKILATGGFFGALSYLLLMGGIYLRLFLSKTNLINNVKIPLILILGLSVSFIYTYHIRKREYWVFIFLLFLLLHVRKSPRILGKNNIKH